ncbi:DUF308 domain-containing protein [Bradyrhizobium sp. UFLA05-112]
MALALLIAGIFAFVAGLLTVLWGISLKEFSLGSTLILSGTIGVCSGMLLMGLYTVVQELKGIARRLAATTALSEVRVRPVLPPGLATAGASGPEAVPGEAAKVDPMMPVSPAAPPPWQDEAAARTRAEVPPMPEASAATPEGPRRRNLLFASTSRKERDRAQAKASEAEPGEEHPAPAEPPQASFDDAWPKPERMRPPEAAPLRRPPPPRMPSSFTEAAPAPASPPTPEPRPAPPAEQPAVTVLKSGVVDGMAYSLYSDGSIEAQMPEGMMRFASIDELRTHLDQRS